MIRHVVMWRFKQENKKNNMIQLKAMLEALPEQIPQIQGLETGIHDNPDSAGWDMALITVFRNLDDLQSYRIHPAHKAVSAYCSSIREDRAVVDYSFEVQ